MLTVQDLILRTQSEVLAVKQRAVKLARMWEERKHSTGSPRADRALVLMEVARDAALAAGVIQEIKMALDAKEFIDLLVRFRFVETVDDEGAARDFLARQPKEKVEEFAARFFNVFKVTTNTYGGVFLDRSGRPLLVEGPRLVAFVKWFVEQLLAEKEADEGVRYFKSVEDEAEKLANAAHDDRLKKAQLLAELAQAAPPSVPASLIEAIKNVDISGAAVNVMGGELQPNGDLVLPPHEGEPITIATKPMVFTDGEGNVLATVTAEAENTFPDMKRDESISEPDQCYALETLWRKARGETA
jgi:hypothetical protein